MWLVVLLYSCSEETCEDLVSIHCKLSNPPINSHHDILLSSVKLPHRSEENSNEEENITAPRVSNLRTKIMWTDAGIEDYENIVANGLKHIQNLWLASEPSTSCLQIALQATNSSMNSAAFMTNKSINLGKPQTFRSNFCPKGNKVINEGSPEQTSTSEKLPRNSPRQE